MLTKALAGAGQDPSGGRMRSGQHGRGPPSGAEHPGGGPVTGEAALRRLEEEIGRPEAVVGRDLPDPARYPAVAVRPSPVWVSQVGGPWANVWKVRP